MYFDGRPVTTQYCDFGERTRRRCDGKTFSNVDESLKEMNVREHFMASISWATLDDVVASTPVSDAVRLETKLSEFGTISSTIVSTIGAVVEKYLITGPTMCLCLINLVRFFLSNSNCWKRSKKKKRKMIDEKQRKRFLKQT